MVLLSQGKEVKSYRVALGGQPVGPKQRQGDHKTPEGSYLLDFRNSHSRYYKSFHISYPSPQDLTAAKRRGVPPGGDIMLHGLPKGYEWLGKAHRQVDWTEGCIAVSNEEMDELWNLLREGTPIDIKP
jgi:murein L,D-transpeptidase YafK